MPSRKPRLEGQFALPGFELDLKNARRSRPKAPYNLFFALYPEDEIASFIARRATSLCHELGLDGHLQRPDRLHVSLHNLGGYWSVPQAQIDAGMKVATSVRRHSFEIVFDRVSCFGGRAFVLRGTDGVAEVAAFRKALGTVMELNGMSWERSFTPHMTIAYQEQRIPDQEIEPIRLAAKKFELILSHVGRSIHESLGEWSLGN